MLRFCANLGFLFTEVDFEQRFECAARAGFRGVEYMFPYAYPPERLQRCLSDSALTQVLFNLPAGDWAMGERGIACLPGREAEFRAGVAQAINYANALGCRQLNCLAGLAPAGVADTQIGETLKANLRYAAAKLGEHNIRLLVEPINSRVDMPGFWLDTPSKALALIDELAVPNLWLQYDIYHAQIMEGDLARRISGSLARIGHLQLADNPGRHEPGTGEINYPFLFELLDSLGYSGWIGCEYQPLAGTEAGLGWLAKLGG